MRKVLAILIFLLVPSITFAQSQTQGLTVMSSCESGGLEVGGATNTNVVSAISQLLGDTWLNNHAGSRVVARFGDGNQATFQVTSAGTLTQPTGSTGCVEQDMNAWSWYDILGEGTITDDDGGGTVTVTDGNFTGGPWAPPPGDQH